MVFLTSMFWNDPDSYRDFGMNRIFGQSRHQVEFGCLEDGTYGEIPVRVIDAFVGKLELIQIGIQSKRDKT